MNWLPVARALLELRKHPGLKSVDIPRALRDAFAVSANWTRKSPRREVDCDAFVAPTKPVVPANSEQPAPDVDRWLTEERDMLLIVISTQESLLAKTDEELAELDADIYGATPAETRAGISELLADAEKALALLYPARPGVIQ